jgi:hypothetical protein
MSNCSASANAAANANPNLPYRVNDFSTYPIAFFASIFQGDDFLLPISFYSTNGGGEDLTGQTFALSVDWKFYQRDWGWREYMNKPFLLYSQVLVGDPSGNLFFNIPGYGGSGLPYLPGWCGCFGTPCATLPIGTLALEVKRWFPVSGVRVTTLKGNLVVKRSVNYMATPVYPAPA